MKPIENGSAKLRFLNTFTFTLIFSILSESRDFNEQKAHRLL